MRTYTAKVQIKKLGKLQRKMLLKGDIEAAANISRRIVKLMDAGVLSLKLEVEL